MFDNNVLLSGSFEIGGGTGSSLLLKSAQSPPPLSSPLSPPLSSPLSPPLSSPLSPPLSSPLSPPLSSPLSPPLSSLHLSPVVDDDAFYPEYEPQLAPEVAPSTEGLLRRLSADSIGEMVSFLTLPEILRLDQAFNNSSVLSQTFANVAGTIDFDFGVAGDSCVETTKLVSFVASKFPTARSLTFRYPVNNRFSVRLVSQFKDLGHLSVSSNFLYTSDLMTIGKACPSLQTLSLRSICTEGRDEGRAVLSELQHFPALTDLTVAYCRDLDDSCLQLIGTGCKALKSLNVECSQGITGRGVSLLCQQCVSLTCLDVSDCPDMTDDVLQAVSDSLPRLRTLKLRDCDNLTWQGVWPLLSRKSKSLWHLALPRCFSVDFSGATALPPCGLISLDVSFLTSVTDQFVKALSRWCPTLQELTVKGCPQLTSECMQFLEDKFQSLRSLHIGTLSTTPHLTQMDLDALITARGDGFLHIIPEMPDYYSDMFALIEEEEEEAAKEENKKNKAAAALKQNNAKPPPKGMTWKQVNESKKRIKNKTNNSNRGGHDSYRGGDDRDRDGNRASFSSRR